MVSQDERNFALLAHLLSFFAPILAPLIIWLLKKDESRFIDAHAKESLNFQISLIIYGFACLILSIILIGILLAIVLAIVAVVCVLIATVKAANGEYYRYPFTIRLLK